MNDLKVFNNEKFGQIRTVEIKGKLYFVGKDITKALGYVNSQDAIKKHCRWVAKREVPHPQSKTKTIEVNVIPEGDIYRLITNSELPSAEEFESWVFDEVLPTIRKYGMYAKDDLLNNPDLLIEVATQLKAEKQARVEAERKNAILMHTNKTYTATEIAKELGFKSAIALNKDLCDKGIQYKVNNTYVLYSDYADLGYVSIKQQILDSGKEVYSRHFTQDGRDFILNLYNMQEKAN